MDIGCKFEDNIKPYNSRFLVMVTRYLLYRFVKKHFRYLINPLRPNNDLSQTSRCNIKGLSVSEVMRIDNMITQVRFY